jgi:DNA-binding transcriptional MerR regulator
VALTTDHPDALEARRTIIVHAPHHHTPPTSDLMTIENRPHQIGELAETFGITMRSIRFYEERGLIKPGRIGLNTRVYDATDVARLGLIVTCRRFRFTIDEIRALLAERDTAGYTAFEARWFEALTVRHAELTAEIAETEKLRHDLFGVVSELRRSR